MGRMEWSEGAATGTTVIAQSINILKKKVQIGSYRIAMTKWQWKKI